MSWAIGFDSNWNRDIGYGVPATCDHPGCGKEIDRGLGYVCGSEPYGGEHGCGLFFCGEHLSFVDDHGAPLCERCQASGGPNPFTPTPDIPEWVQHKLTDESWAKWRSENPATVLELIAAARQQSPEKEP